MNRIAQLLAGLCVAGIAPAAAARPVPPPFIVWGDCPVSLVGDTWPGLGPRLHCGHARMPFDHLAPDGRTIDVAVVRVAAGDPSRREGALFIHVGGPGGQPAGYVASMAATFSEVDANDPVHGDKRRLADRFDLIAVIPRGLKGGWTYECKVDPPRHVFLPAHRDDANWRLLVADARAQAEACSRAAEAPYLSTEQHVRDMDAVRRSLGDETLNFYGISYGGRVGATYAAFFPERMGRMLLDSSMIFPGGYRLATYATADAAQEAFERDILGPILRDPRRFGQPADPGALHWATRSFSDVVRPAWHDALVSPYHLAAALTMDRWVKAGGWHGWKTLQDLVRTEPFGADAATEPAIRAAAAELAARGANPPAPAWRGDDAVGHPLIDRHGDWMNLAIMCNDEDGETWLPKIRARADRDAFQYTQLDGSQILDQVACAFWPRRVARSPDFAVLETRAPFLLIHAEHDAATPLAGARAILRRYRNSHLVVARGGGMHGLFGHSATPCVEAAALAYLLDGRLPQGADRETGCAFEAMPAGHRYDSYDSYEVDD